VAASSPALSFVLTKNANGHDAAMEARAAGHTAVGKWLDALVARLDPDGKRFHEGGRKQMDEELRMFSNWEMDRGKTCIDDSEGVTLTDEEIAEWKARVAQGG